MKRRFYILLIAFIVLFVMHTDVLESETMSEVEIVCNRWPANLSIQQFAKDAIRLEGAESNEEKALAVFRYIRMWTSRTDGKIPRESAFGNDYIDDPLKILNVYGAHHCDGLSRILEVAWRSLGYRAEKLYRSNHTQANLYWKDLDGKNRWHLFDVSEGWFIYDRTGKHIASPDEIATDYSLIYRPSRGYIPAHKTYWGMYNWIHAPHIQWPDYSPRLKMQQGDKVIFYWGNIGKPYLDNFAKKGKTDFEHGPYPVTYGNGVFIKRPLWSAVGIEKRRQGNISHAIVGEINKKGSSTIHPAASGVQSQIVIPIESPFIISDVLLNFDSVTTSIKDYIEVFISVDKGGSWKKIWHTRNPGKDRVRDLSVPSPFGHYKYWLNISMLAISNPEHVSFGNLSVKTIFQHNIFSLPQLLPGENMINIHGELEKGVSLDVAYRWADILSENRQNIERVQELPYQYKIKTKAKNWNDLKCRSLTIEVTPKTNMTPAMKRSEDFFQQKTVVKPVQLFETDRIVGSKEPKPLKTIGEYINDLKFPKKQVEAISGLMILQAAQAFNPIKEIALNSIKHPNKEIAIQALYKINQYESIPILLDILKKSPQVKFKNSQNNEFVELEHWYQISALIGRILAIAGEKRAVSPLSDVLNDILSSKNKSWEPHGSIIKSLGMLKNPLAINSIRPFLDQNYDVASQAIWALGELGDQKSVKKIKTLFYTSDYPMIINSAAEALGKLGAKEIVPDLCKMLLHPDENFRGSAVFSLGLLGDMAVVPDLNRLIKNEKFEWVISLSKKSLEEIKVRKVHI